MPPRTSDAAHAGAEDVVLYPAHDRITVALLAVPCVVAASAVATEAEASLPDAAPAIVVTALAFAVPLWHRARAGSRSAWRVGATLALVAGVFAALAAGLPLDPRVPLLLVIAYVATYADWRLPVLAAAAGAALHAAFLRLEPAWVAGDASGWSVAAILAAAAVVSGWSAFAYRSAVARREAMRGASEAHIERSRRLEDALRATEQRLGATLDALPDGTAILDAAGRVGYANHAAGRILGTSRHDLVRGAAIDPSSPLFPLLRAAGEGAPLRDILRVGTPLLDVPCNVRVRGETRHLSANVVPLRDPGADPSALVVSFRDVTDRIREAEELDGARRQLARSEKLSALGTLVSGVAHEIRTPLTYIQNSLYVLDARLRRLASDDERYRPVVAEAKDPVASALDGVARINRLVTELRRITKSQRGERQSLPVNVVVAQAIDLFRATYRGGTQVRADLHATLPCDVDPIQVHEVVLNLMENAADAMRGGGVVRVATRPVAGGAEVLVDDEGPGIPPAIHGRVFEEFFTTKPHGTGLGLSIIRRIVDAHGGTVGFESAAGRGTRFRVFLPYRPPIVVEARPS